MSDDNEHPIIDRVFDRLEPGGRLGVELFLRGAKGTKRALERTVGLLENVGEYAEKRLEELDQEPQEEPKPKAPPHTPEPDENGVARDKNFDFLDRP